MFSGLYRQGINVKNILLLYNKFDISLTLRRYKMEDLQNNPFFNKYAEKIAELQKESPEELKKKLEENAKRKNQNKNQIKVKERPYSVPSQAKSQISSSPTTQIKKLNEIMKVELLKDKSSEEIEHLWIAYHKNKDTIVGVVPEKTHAVMHGRGQEFPVFLLPLPRTQGYEFIMCQYSGYEVHFTPLIAYQTHKENAPECLTLTFYCDLLEEKGIVLMKGEYDTNILNCQEAQCLVNEFQLYYAQNHEKKLKLLQEFTYNSSKFDHMDLIKEVETLSL